MIRLSAQTEVLARQIATARGISPEQAVKLALEKTSKELSSPSARGERLSKDELILRMEQISARCGSRPLVDPRSPDELIGYDDYGLPR
jgi:antitoxin VapB